jgi:hypothetical protein
MLSYLVGFEFLTALSMKMAVFLGCVHRVVWQKFAEVLAASIIRSFLYLNLSPFYLKMTALWYIPPCSVAEVYGRFGSISASIIRSMSHSKYLWNVDELLLDYAAQQSSLKSYLLSSFPLSFIFPPVLWFYSPSVPQFSYQFPSDSSLLLWLSLWFTHHVTLWM